MTELALYKFIKENNVEYHWIDNNTDVIIFVYIWNVEEFNKLLPDLLFDEEGIECNMKDRYFAFRMKDICEYCDIDMKAVFDNEE